jgi:ubiquinone/menaquinone biosynthesis C-methylase UbiE
MTAFELLRAGLEFDLFEKLECAGGMDLAEVAAAIDVDEQAARILLLGLTSLLLLEKEGEKYVNSEIVRHRLLQSSPRFLGTLVDVHARIINPSLPDFVESMKQNTNVGLRRISGPGDTLYERLTASPALQKVFYDNMGTVSQTVFSQILSRYDFSDVRHVIDVGGGDGANAVELATRHPHLEVTVFDQESVVRLAADRVEDPDLRRRVHFHAGDLHADPLPTGADVIMFFHLFEIWSLERNTELLRKCYAALPEGGVCLVYNFVSNDDGTASMSAGLMSPYFLTLASGEGMAYSPADMEQAVLDAGFSTVERFQNMGFSHALVIGYK